MIHIKKNCFALVLVFACSSPLHSDIGHFDIFELRWQGQKYYVTLESRGVLKDNDLCYYDYNGNYKMEVEDFLDQWFSRIEEVFTYTGLEEIHLDSIMSESGYANFESPIFILKDWHPVSTDSIRGKYELLGARKGHTFGVESSQTITEKDNEWINRSTMRYAFGVDNGECFYRFYSSNIQVGSKMAIVLQKELQELMPIGEGEYDRELDATRERRFRRRVEELVAEKILMVGACSC
ncbi:MAG: hypothetical protein AAF391_11420 [Bacteroidota bacterium]